MNTAKKATEGIEVHRVMFCRATHCSRKRMQQSKKRKESRFLDFEKKNVKYTTASLTAESDGEKSKGQGRTFYRTGLYVCNFPSVL